MTTPHIYTRYIFLDLATLGYMPALLLIFLHIHFFFSSSVACKAVIHLPPLSKSGGLSVNQKYIYFGGKQNFFSAKLDIFEIKDVSEN